MSWTYNSVISAEFRQSYLGQSVMNKLFWKITLLIGDVIIEEILDLLAAWVVSQLTTVQSADLTHVEQLFLDETDGIGVYLASHSATGLVTGGVNAPTFNAFALTKGVGNRLTRPGGIRIAGVQEEATIGNSLTAAYIGALNNIGAALETPKELEDSFGGIMRFTPVVVGRDEFGHVDLNRVNIVTNMSSPKITSQVSRRPK